MSKKKGLPFGHTFEYKSSAEKWKKATKAKTRIRKTQGGYRLYKA